MRNISRLIFEYPKTILFAVLLITVIFASFIPKLHIDNTVRAFVMEDDPELLYFDRYKEQFGTDEFIVIAFQRERIFDRKSLELIDRITRKVEDLDNVRDVISLTNVNNIRGTEQDFIVERLVKEIPSTEEEMKELEKEALSNPLYLNDLISKDGKTTAILVKLEDIPGDDVYKKVLVEEIKGILDEEMENQPFYLSGKTVIDYSLAHYMQKDLKLFLPITILLIALILYVLFRNIIGVIFPMMTVFICLIWTMGFLYLEKSSINNVSTMLPPLIMALSVAIGVHVLTQYRREASIAKDREETFIDTVHHLLIPCLLTSLTTAAGFASLGVSSIPAVRDFGIVAAVGMLFSFLITITFLPIILYLTKRPPTKVVKTQEPDILDRFLLKIGHFNQYWTKRILLISVLVVIFSLIGISRLRVETNLLEFFKKHSPVYQSTSFIEDNLSGVSSINVSLEAERIDTFKEPQVLRKVEDLQDFLKNRPKIDKVTSLVDYIKDMNQSFHNENPEYYRIPHSRKLIAQYLLLYDAEDLENYVDSHYLWATVSARVREHSSARLKGLIDDTKAYINENFSQGLEVRVTGNSVLDSNLIDILVKSQINSLALAMFVIFGMMFILFRSVKIGLLSIIPNVIPILINFGLMGWLGVPLNTATAMIAVVAIGIAVDDTIHFLSCFASEMKKDGDHLQSMYRTLSLKGRAIISTSIILFLGFGILISSSFAPTIYFGVLTAGIMVSALLGDLIILSALLVFFKPKFGGPSKNDK